MNSQFNPINHENNPQKKSAAIFAASSLFD